MGCCKINFFRRRRQRLAAHEKRKKLLAPNKPPRGSLERFFIAPGISVRKGNIYRSGDGESCCEPVELRYRFPECHEASFSPGRTIKIRTMIDTHIMGNPTVVKSVADITSPVIPYETICIEAKTKSEGLE